jgi:hypothetical protein
MPCRHLGWRAELALVPAARTRFPARLGLDAELAELLKDEVTHGGLVLGGHPAHPRDDPAPIRWQIFRARPATDRTPGDEHITDAALQHRGVRLGDPGAVTVTDAEAADALGAQWQVVRGIVRRAAVAKAAEAARFREAWESALDDGDGLAAAADAVHHAHRASRRATIGAGAWDAIMRADAASRRIDAERVGTAAMLAAACAARDDGGGPHRQARLDRSGRRAGSGTVGRGVRGNWLTRCGDAHQSVTRV